MKTAPGACSNPTKIRPYTRDEIFSFVAENCTESDYAKYGFDNPKYVLEVTAEANILK